MDIVLASASPRRHELLGIAGIRHLVVVSSADESSIEYVPGEPERYVTSVAELKNRAVREKLRSDTRSVIVSADTVVYLPSTREILGKPCGRESAIAMLRSLSGERHCVVTGVSVFDAKSGKTSTFAESTDVYFRALTEEEITDYVDLERPFDKAGAYGIQEGASIFVSRIDGDYFNIVGLPLCRLYTVLTSIC